MSLLWLVIMAASKANNFHTSVKENEQQVRQKKKKCVGYKEKKKKVPPQELNLAYTPTTCRMELNESTTTSRTYLF